MEKKKLFGNDIKPACEYCEHSKTINESLRCDKFGEVKPYDSCKQFSYSPLKRTPTKKLSL